MKVDDLVAPGDVGGSAGVVTFCGEVPVSDVSRLDMDSRLELPLPATVPGQRRADDGAARTARSRLAGPSSLLAAVEQGQ